MRVGKVITCDLGESQDPVQTILYILDSGGSRTLKDSFLGRHGSLHSAMPPEGPSLPSHRKIDSSVL